MHVDFADLGDRWKRARLAAIKSVIDNVSDEADLFLNIQSISEEKYEDLLKGVYLNSQKLGGSFQKGLNLSLEQDDFIIGASKLGSPCLTGLWTKTSNASVLTREGCEQGKKIGNRYCQYWREAIDGLVVGITESESFARHQSLGAGDNHCQDIIYTDLHNQTETIWKNKQRWGEVPKDMELPLTEIRNRFERLKVDLNFLGLKEQTLYYKLESEENLTCGGSGSIYRTMLKDMINEKWKNLRIVDASPLAVYGEKS